MTHEEKYVKALNAINALFSDTSVPAETIRRNLEALTSEIEVMIDSIKNTD